LKVQLVGPWTLAATLQTARGPVLGDPGAVRDLVESLVETVREHVAEVSRRAPHAQLWLQVDEPGLAGVLAGDVPTASGWGRVRAVEPVAAGAGLRAVVAAAGIPVAVHCCARDVPFRLLAETGAAAVSFDLSQAELDRDALGTMVEAGTVLWLGSLPSSGPGVPPVPREVAEPVRRLWHELGFAPELLPSRVVVTPACGLAGASEGWARTALRLVRQAARMLDDAPDSVRS
jgi:methionine synthase II (cobalamin-independent)